MTIDEYFNLKRGDVIYPNEELKSKGQYKVLYKSADKLYLESVNNHVFGLELDYVVNNYQIQNPLITHMPSNEKPAVTQYRGTLRYNIGDEVWAITSSSDDNFYVSKHKIAGFKIEVLPDKDGKLEPKGEYYLYYSDGTSYSTYVTYPESALYPTKDSAIKATINGKEIK